MAGHESDSRVQRDAEALILDAVQKYVGMELAPRLVRFDSGATVQVDGAPSDESLFVEIFARQGALKGGQQRKVSQDALKLVTLGRSRPSARLILAFADEQAAAYATKGTWVSEALRTWGVEVLVVELGQAVRDRIRGAQVQQQMVNPAASPPANAQPDRALRRGVARALLVRARNDSAGTLGGRRRNGGSCLADWLPLNRRPVGCRFVTADAQYCTDIGQRETHQPTGDDRLRPQAVARSAQ